MGFTMDMIRMDMIRMDMIWIWMDMMDVMDMIWIWMDVVTMDMDNGHQQLLHLAPGFTSGVASKRPANQPYDIITILTFHQAVC